MESANIKLNWYFGELLPEQIVNGANHAITNAKRLIEDAELLFQNGRYPSAVGLAILASEEVGKVPILRGIAIASNKKELQKQWKEYRKHIVKNWPLVVAKHFLSGARKLKDFQPLLKHSKEPQLIDNLKQVSFYTDCLDDAKWAIPTNLVNGEMARWIIECVRYLIGFFHEVTKKEIEILIKHIGPVSKKGEKPSKAVIEKYYNELKSMGLMSELDIEYFLED